MASAAELTREQRDSYGTPVEVYRYFDRRFHFSADMAASDENHLHPTVWFTKERSCLGVSWAEYLEKQCGVRRWETPSPPLSGTTSQTLVTRYLLKKRPASETASADRVPPFVWINPPYSMPDEFLCKCAHECTRGVGSVVLLKEQDGEMYWAEHVAEKAAEVIHITGRLAYIHPVTKTPKQGCSFGSIVVVYDPRHAPGTPTIASWISRQAFYAM